MRKVLAVLAIGAVLAMGMGGCSSTPAKAKVTADFKGAPKWVYQPELEGNVVAVASSKIDGDIQMAKEEALANARNELARELSISVKNMIKNFVETTGTGDSKTIDKVSQNVTNQMTNQVLSGSKQKDMWVSETNIMFIMVGLETAALKQSVKEAANTSFKNEDAMWQQIQAAKAQEELEKQINKEFGKK